MLISPSPQYEGKCRLMHMLTVANITVYCVLAIWYISSSVRSYVPVALPGGGGSTPPPRNSEGPPKSCQTQPDCENG